MSLSTDERVHRQPYEPTGGGPARGGQVGLGGTGQNESTRARIVIDGPLDRAEDLGDQLPLIDKDRLVESTECGVGVGANDRRLGRDVQPQDGTAQSPRRGGFSAGTRADNERGWMSRQDLGELCVSDAGHVGVQRRPPAVTI